MVSTKLLSAFRPIGAVDNNLINPSLNPTVDSPELSIAPTNFAAGTERGLVDGTNPRTISNEVSGATNDPTANAGTEDATGASAWLYVFGQFVDHDLDLESVGTTDISVTVPAGDAELAAGSSIPLTRVITDPTTGTITDTVAGFLDLSQVYGSTTATANALRNPDGSLKTSDNGQALPTAVANEPPTVFTGAAAGQLVSGDGRVDENPELTAVTTLFVREHNYWVGVLKASIPTWSGDQLYGMAKAITTAEYQNIIYTEYLPALIGQGAVGAYTGYDPTVSAAVSQEFSTAAFRVGHSQVSGAQTQINNDGTVTGTETLAQSFFNTASQDEANAGINSLLRDLSNDASQQVDVYAVDDIRNLLAASPAQMDLIATDIQRERDVGLGT
jgi:peroxidase